MAITARTPTSSDSGTTATTSVTLTKPTGTTTGDVLLASFSADGSGTPSAVPSGWTLLGSVTNLSNPHIYAYYRQVVAGDSATTSWTWTLNAAEVWGGNVQAFAGVDPATPLDTAAVTMSNATATTTSFPVSITTVTDGAMLVSTLGANTGASVTPTPPAGFTSDTLVNAGFTAGKANSLAHMLLGSAGAGSYTWTINSGRAGGVIIGALRPAAAPVVVAQFVRQATAFGADNTTSTTATFGAATASGNLLVGVLAGDKNTGTATWPSGWSVICSLPSASVSLYYAWKVSAGETSVTVTTSTVSGSGSELWVGEYQDTAAAGPWQMLASASNVTDETAPTTWSTGTTAAISRAGLGVAVAAMDSATSSGGTWSNGFTSRFASTYVVGEGHGAAYVGEKPVLAGATAQSNLTWADADQVSAAVAVFSRQPGIPKSLAGSVTVTGRDSHQTVKAPGGAVSATQVLRRSGLARALAGAVTPAGAKTSRLTRNTLYGAIFTTATTQRGYPRSLGGAITAASALAKRSAGRFMGGTITAAGATQRAVQHPLTATIAVTAPPLRRAFARTHTGTTAPQGVTQRIAVRVRVMAGSLTPAGAAARVANKRHLGSAQPTGLIKPRSILKRPKGTVAATSTLLAGLFRRVFGPAGTCTGTLTASAEVEADLFLAHRVQVVVEVLATAD